MGATTKKEIAESRAMTISEQAMSALTTQAVEIEVGGQKFRAIKRVTVPTLSHNFAAGETTVAIEFLTKFNGQPSKMPGAREGAMTYAARVVNLTTGEVANYVASTVVLSEINQAYPEDSYVGKKLIIEKIPGPSGRRYNRANIVEVE